MSETSLSLDPVARTPRLSDLVSERLLAAIREAHLPPGSKLPSERELGDQFGVSRTVIREAVRDLAARGILEVRSGSGATVARVDSSNVSDAITLFLRRKGLLDPRKIHEVRQTIELQTVRLAARHGTDEHIAEIRRTHERLAEVQSDPEEASNADVEFHRAIAKATENELFLMLVDSLSDVMLDVRRATVGREGRIQIGIRHHELIVEALERRDVEGAVGAMRDHLLDSLEAFSASGTHALPPVRGSGRRTGKSG
jgi:GntR family transcriptional regulator, transcriptional repressor for pyruvate dehydrogenase complex